MACDVDILLFKCYYEQNKVKIMFNSVDERNINNESVLDNSADLLYCFHLWHN